MREAKWIKKSAFCRNSSLIGYSRKTVDVGDWVLFSSTTPTCGRFLGVLTEMPNDGLEDCTGWLLVACVNESLEYNFVRWVDPELVLRTMRNEDIQHVFASSCGDIDSLTRKVTDRD
jgi:hypothetical protein